MANAFEAEVQRPGSTQHTPRAEHRHQIRQQVPGNTLYVRGQVGTDFDGNLVGLGDPRAQAEQAMKNVKQLLEEAGSDLSHIVKTTTYLIDPRYREPVYQEVGKWLKGVFPISTGLVISGLGQPEWLMEIDVIAVVPDDWTV